MLEYRIIREGDILTEPGSPEIVAGRTGNPTITLIKSNKDILVDPGQKSPFNPLDGAIALLNSLAKYVPSKELYLFVTHEHNDHCSLIPALMFAAESPAYNWKITEIKKSDGEIADGVLILPTPGHSPEHRSLELRAEKDRIIVAGDAVLSQAYFLQKDKWKRVYAPNEPTESEVDLAVKSMEEIKKRADVIIPGHGKPFRIN